MISNRVGRVVKGFSFIIIAFFLFPPPLFRESLWEESGAVSFPSVFTFLIIYCVSIVGIITALLNKNYWIRTLFEVFIYSTIMMEVLYFIISHHRFTTFDALNITNNSHYSELAIQNFASQFILSLVITTLLYLTLKWCIKDITLRFPAIAIVILLSSFGLIQYHYQTYKIGFENYTTIYRTPLALLTAVEEKQSTVPARKEVDLSAENQKVKHLFYIVDESITADYLSINNPDFNTTPVLEKEKESIINFGKVCAFTNYSSGSNIALMSGAMLSELPDYGKRILTKPTIFYYAKKAGYTTYYIDAQSTDSIMQNYMSKQDFKYIDRYLISKPGEEYWSRDQNFADTLLNLSREDQKIFVYFNKAGAHWPYAKSYPDSLHQKVEFNKTKGVDKSYLLSIRWNVDFFWNKLLNKINKEDSTLVVYTSDHGQSFTSNAMRHGTLYDPAPEEASVPLIIYDPTKAIEIQSGKRNGQYSHQQIFPTLLNVMGYDKDFISQSYGATLLDDIDRENATFISGDIFGRGGVYKNSFIKVVGNKKGQELYQGLMDE